jgi:hypothetical protein
VNVNIEIDDWEEAKLNEDVNYFFWSGVSGKVLDDDVAELEPRDNVLDVEPGGAGNGWQPPFLSELRSLVDISFQLVPSPPSRPSPALSSPPSALSRAILASFSLLWYQIIVEMFERRGKKSVSATSILGRTFITKSL